MKTNTLYIYNLFVTTLLLFISNITFAQIIVNPEPISGKNMTKSTIQHHMVYPQNALDNNIGGKIKVLFTVDKEGNSYNHHIEESFDSECAEEAIRLVRQIMWKPATKDGIPFEKNYEYTVDFSPKSYKKYIEKNKIRFIPQQASVADTSFIIYDYKEIDTAPKAYFDNPNTTIASYLRSELRYPDQAKEFEISGTVKLNFIIETDGKASNIVIENSVGGGCDNEAVRLLQNLLWTPGVKNDCLVRTQTSLDITFQFGERSYHDGNQY